MIVTVTLNPAVDKTIFVDSLSPGTIHRVYDSHLDAAGKGINVSRLVDRLGWPSIAFGVLAGEIGLLVAKALEDEGVQSSFLRVAGQTRLNATVFDRSTGRGTSFYDEGPKVDVEALGRLKVEIAPWIGICRVLVLAGSLPPGLPDDAYAGFVELGHSAGVPVILDTAGAPLRFGIGAGPDLIKPNLAEMEALVGRRLPDLPAVVEAACEVMSSGVEVVVVSMGANGAVCVRGDQAWHASPPEVELKSTVGSGDSMVAGLALSLARGQGIVEGLRLGTAAGAATAMVSGTALATPEDIARLLPLVRIRELEVSCR